MQLLSIFGALALIPAVLSSPVTGSNLAVRDDDRGQYAISGLGARKQEVIRAGGNTRDLAIAMLETDKMTTDYTYGMSKCILGGAKRVLIKRFTGDGKSGDGTNFGIFKQNWYMLRNSASEFMGKSVSQVSEGAILK
jgi:hypothetical protein